MKAGKSIDTFAKGLNFFRSSKLKSFAQSIYDSNPDNTRFTFMDIANEEIKELLIGLDSYNVKYMVVGGVATIFHGHIRTTKDLDLWVKESHQNDMQLVEALKKYIVSEPDDFLKLPLIKANFTVSIGSEKFVVNFMNHLKAFQKEDFDSCYKEATKTSFDGIPITVIHLNHLVKEKNALARFKDLDDVLNLKKIKKQEERGV